MKKLLSVAVLLLLISVMMLAAPPRPVAQTQVAQTQVAPTQVAQNQVPQAQAAPTQYVPQAVFCANGSNTLCSILPAYIGPDPKLKLTIGYNGLYGPPPQQASDDVQTPFDNMAWQMFVALNWASGAVNQPATNGLTKPGLRVWQTYRKVSALFGNSPVTPGCTQALALPTFYIGSDGKGNPAPNNEEYLQASSNLPLIDINGNWTLFERRVNDIEANYLLAPNGQASQTLTTISGQNNFIKNNHDGVQFTSSATVPDGRNGSMELKAAWRIIDRAKGDDPSRYYTQSALLAVAGDLARGGRPFCRSVTLGLVGMHILQRNPVDSKNPALLPQWIWATFEHADNAPLAQTPCNVRNGCGTAPATNWINQPSCGPAKAAPTVHYSFFRQNPPVQGTNIAPVPPDGGKTYLWNPQPPYARAATTPASAMSQAVRCWEIYSTTQALNAQWRPALGQLKSVFQNYMLVGTQWGGTVEPPAPPNPVPAGAVPGMLSDTTLETYIQNNTGSDKNAKGGPGSCVSCHSFATLPADNKTSANFSFLPGLADPSTARSKIKTAR
jgi:hypothetical protein